MKRDPVKAVQIGAGTVAGAAMAVALCLQAINDVRREAGEMITNAVTAAETGPQMPDPVLDLETRLDTLETRVDTLEAAKQ